MEFPTLLGDNTKAAATKALAAGEGAAEASAGAAVATAGGALGAKRPGKVWNYSM